MVAFLYQLAMAICHVFESEFADGQPLHDAVMPVFASDREAVQHAFGYAIAAVGWHTHGHPVVVMRTEHPVMDARDGGIGDGARDRECSGD